MTSTSRNDPDPGVPVLYVDTIHHPLSAAWEIDLLHERMQDYLASVGLTGEYSRKQITIRAADIPGRLISRDEAEEVLRWLMKHSTDLLFRLSGRPLPGGRKLGLVDGD